MGSILSLSFDFLGKERERAKSSTQMLFHFFEYELSSITKEMFTANYESISWRVAKVSRSVGAQSFDLQLIDSNFRCKRRFVGASIELPCVPSTQQGGLARELYPTKALTRPLLRFDSETQRYVYAAPLEFASNLVGYILVTVPDGSLFYRGNSPMFIVSVLAVPLLLSVLIWAVWLAVSKKYLIRPYAETIAELQSSKALSVLATRVAHNIRSPLAALSVAVKSGHHSTVESGDLIRSAITRIREIADELLTHHRSGSTPSTNGFTFVSSTLKLLTKSSAASTGIDVHMHCGPESASTCIAMPRSEFSQVISNLLQNALEATPKQRPGPAVILRTTTNACVIKITDNGRGIPPAVLQAIETKGGSYGKPSGNGIGLTYARETVLRYGGTLEIESQVGFGTTVTVYIPTIVTPFWLRPEEFRMSDKAYVVLDDDISIHKLWRKFLGSKNVVSLFDPRDFSPEKFPESHFRYLVDNDLGSDRPTGIDLIRKFKIERSSVLVTSGSDDAEVVSECMNLGIQLLPKPDLAELAHI